MKKFTTCLAVFAQLSLASSACLAISGNRQVELAGSGQYEELRQGLEEDAAKAPLKTPDLHALCFAYSKTKRYNKLLPCLDDLEKNIAKGDKRTRLFGLEDATPTVYLMRSEALLELGQYPQASDEAQKALDWFQQTNSDDTDVKINALTFQSLAAAFGGDRAKAEKYAQQIEQISTSWPFSSDFKSIKAMGLARAYMALGKYDRTFAAISNDKAFAVHAFLDKLVSGAFLTGKNNWAWEELPRGFMLNKALYGMGRTAEARDGYDRLLKIPQARENGEIYWLILYDRGQIAESEKKSEDAISFYGKAIDVIESQRMSINTEASKIGFVGDKQQVYGHMINALFAAGRDSEAFEYIERSKSRALVDLLATKQAFGASTKAAPETKQLLEQYQAEETEVLAQVPVSAAEGKSTQRNIAARTVERIRTVAPELSALVSVTSMPSKELQGLIQPDETMIQYYYEGRDFYAFVVDRTSIKTVRLDIDGLEGDVRKFREQIDQRDDAVVATAQSLYRRLIKPIEADIENRNLLIIPHGILHYLPFSALNDGHDYLIAGHPVRVLPSASVLKYLRPTHAGKVDSLLLFGNPDLGSELYDLPSAQAEAEDIGKQFKQSTLLTRKRASETAFKQLSPKFHYIHIASHGEFDASNPLKSALLLSKDSSNDGMLTVNELYSLQLDADLVTLSACETGLGKVSNGDDVVGLTRGFFYAGASSVIASLWQVDDSATSYLMTRLYTQLDTRNKRDALRNAQLETMKKYPHPFYWAAFYLTGNIVRSAAGLSKPRNQHAMVGTGCPPYDFRQSSTTFVIRSHAVG